MLAMLTFECFFETIVTHLHIWKNQQTQCTTSNKFSGNWVGPIPCVKLLFLDDFLELKNNFQDDQTGLRFLMYNVGLTIVI